MLDKWMARGTVGVALFAVMSFFVWSSSGVDISWSLFFFGALVSCIFGVMAHITLRIEMSPKCNKYVQPPKILESFHNLILSAIEEEDEKRTSKDESEAPVFSRNIDKEINGILHNLIDDNVSAWLGPLLRSEENTDSLDEVKTMVRRDLWIALKRLSERLSKVDKVHLLASEVMQKVTDHFERIRIAIQQSPSNKDDEEIKVDFPIHAFLMSEEREIEFLAKVADILIIFLLPKSFSTCIGTRSTLRELLSRHVLYTAIDHITDPSTINSKLLEWILGLQTRALSEENLSLDDLLMPSLDTNRSIKLETFANTGSYQDFLTSLMVSTDLASLKQLRFNILTEIVQATTFGNLSSAKGDKDDEKIKEYVTQLVRAKTISENRLQELGCDPYGWQSVAHNTTSNISMSSSFNSIDTIDSFVAGRKNLSFAAIMNSAFSRRYFYTFLELQDKQDLLGFWAAVEELKEGDRTLWHQLATEIFYTYINKPSRVIRVSRSWLKEIETFLMGDSGPDIFYEIQADVTQTLDTSYYPAFLISELCYKMLEDAHDHNIAITAADQSQGGKDETVALSTSTEHPEAEVETHFNNSLAKSNLEHLSEKLQNKAQALKALKSSLKPESKVLKILQGEVDTLRDDRLSIEQHLERTDSWAEHLGRWRCHVQTVEYLEEEDVLKAVLIVHLPVKRESSKQQRPPSWVCSRNVPEFHSLHKELTPYFAWLKDMALPSASGGAGSGGGNSLINFGSRSQGASGGQTRTEKARSVLQKYIDTVLTDERLNQSEIVYSFLSPSPSHLKTNVKSNNSRSRRTNIDDDQKFHLSSLFKSNSDKDRNHHEATASSRNHWKIGDDLLDTADSCDLGGVDGVAEPLYALIGEVFDMRGVFKIVRKSLMTFVQITYGSTINRQLKDTVAWITSEHMIIRYVRALKTSCWPNGNSSEASPGASSDEGAVEETRRRARELLLKHIPECLTQLVGQQASKMGTAKVFDTLQEKTLNKLLAYDLLELLAYNLFPELVRSYAFQQFRTMSV
jgi:sorting nexin-25